MLCNPCWGKESIFQKILLVEDISWQQERNPSKNQTQTFLF